MLDTKPSSETFPTRYLILLLVLIALGLSSLYSYLLFHSLAEVFSIVVAASIFIVAWAARRSLQNGYLLYLGVAFLYLAVIDTVHLLAYKGMPVFTGYDSNLPTQLWIASRYLLGGVLLSAPLFLRRKINLTRAIVGLGLVSGLLLASIFLGVFPDCYIEGSGLTPFKINSEYIIAGMLAVGLVVLRRNAASFDAVVLSWLTVSVGLNIVSGVAFTTYASVFGFSNLLGHLLKVAAYYFLYRAIVETGFYRPFSLLLRDLKLSEISLLQAQSSLEMRVDERTHQLEEVNLDLRNEINERQKAEQALRESEARFRTIFEKTSLGILVVGTDGIVQSSNTALQEMLGYSADELSNKHIRDITYVDDIPVSERVIERLAGGEIFTYETDKRYLTRQGKPFWSHLSISTVQNNDGVPQFFIGIIKDINEGKRTAEELREVQRRLMNSKEDERLRLARDLHDGPIQELLVTSFQLRQLSLDAAPGDQEKIEQLTLQISKVNQSLRSITRELRPQALAPFGLEKAIRSHADSLQQMYPDLGFDLDLMPDGQALSEATRMALYRVYCQSMDNIVQHAGASQAKITFGFDDDRIWMEIEDNGSGFSPPAGWIQLVRGGHFGLAGMAERVEALGGELSIKSNPGSGTRILINISRTAEVELRDTALQGEIV